MNGTRPGLIKMGKNGDRFIFPKTPACERLQYPRIGMETRPSSLAPCNILSTRRSRKTLKAIKHTLIVLIISILLAGVVSFAVIYQTSMAAASRIETDQQLSQQDLEWLSMKSGLEVTAIQQSLEQAKHARKNPLSYPGFNKYWWKSFLAWLPITLLLTAVAWKARKLVLRRVPHSST